MLEVAEMMLAFGANAWSQNKKYKVDDQSILSSVK